LTVPVAQVVKGSVAASSIERTVSRIGQVGCPQGLIGVNWKVSLDF